MDKEDIYMYACIPMYLLLLLSHFSRVRLFISLPYFTMEYYSAIKKNEITSLAATWVDLEIITLSEESQTEKDKYHTLSLIYGILKKKKIQ